MVSIYQSQTAGYGIYTLLSYDLVRAERGISEHNQFAGNHLFVLLFQVFTVIFICEAFIKLVAMSTHYFKSKWNIFDLIIVIASVVDLGVEGVKGLSTIRVFRLVGT